MDTTRETAVSRMGNMGAEVPAAAIEQQLKRLVLLKPNAVMPMNLLLKREAIVSHRKTFVNEPNTTTSVPVFLFFCAQPTKCYPLSMAAVQADRTLDTTGMAAVAP